MEIRRARAPDAPAVAALVAAGFETYRDFSPPGWQPPAEDLRFHEEELGHRLRHRGVPAAGPGQAGHAVVTRAFQRDG